MDQSTSTSALSTADSELASAEQDGFVAFIESEWKRFAEAFTLKQVTIVVHDKFDAMKVESDLANSWHDSVAVYLTSVDGQRATLCISLVYRVVRKPTFQKSYYEDNSRAYPGERRFFLISPTLTLSSVNKLQQALHKTYGELVAIKVTAF